MARKVLRLFFLLAVGVALAQSELTNDEIRSILKDRVDRVQSVGIVVGLVDEKGTRVIGYGKPSKDSSQTVDGDTVFAIGSVTKVFTTTLLADMVARGEVNLDDPLSKYLPASVKVPARDGKQITLLHLATHTSGLPRDPECKNLLCTNLWSKDKYSIDRLYAFLSSYKLTRDPGAQYEYSNFGVALLGNALALRAGTDYETLVRTRLLEPLKLDDTRMTLTPGMQTRLAKGYTDALKPAAEQEVGALAPAGSLRSTANDLLKFLAANMGLSPSPLLAAMKRAHQTQRDTGDGPDSEIGLGWQILKRFDAEIVWHLGSIDGYRSFIGFNAKTRRGVVLLWNASNEVDDIGRHLLDSRYPLAREREAIKLDPKILDAYAGEYQLEKPPIVLKFTREGSRFFSQVPGQKKYEVFAESPTDFFLRATDSQDTFVRDDTGKVTHVVHHQNGLDYRGTKIK